MLKKGNFKKIKIKLKMFSSSKANFNLNTTLMAFKAPFKNKEKKEDKAHTIEVENQHSILTISRHKIRKKE